MQNYDTHACLMRIFIENSQVDNITKIGKVQLPFLGQKVSNMRDIKLEKIERELHGPRYFWGFLSISREI